MSSIDLISIYVRGDVSSSTTQSATYVVYQGSNNTFESSGIVSLIQNYNPKSLRWEVDANSNEEAKEIVNNICEFLKNNVEIVANGKSAL